jgi:CO/xanthine dehydrogenase Mo-binding subunit
VASRPSNTLLLHRPGCLTGATDACDVRGRLAAAIDELAYELGLDPLELRLRNYAEVHPQSGLPWSSNALRECYEVGAQRFGWSSRNPEVGSTRDGHWKIGYGVAGLSYTWWQVRCQARATITRDGRAYVRSAASDPGTGTRTVMRKLSGERLGLCSTTSASSSATPTGLVLSSRRLRAHRVTRKRHPRSVRRAPAAIPRHRRRRRAIATAWLSLNEVEVAAGHIHRRDDPSAGESYTDILARHGLDELTANAEATPPSQEHNNLALSGPFAAKFVEVRVDEDLGLIRVARVTTTTTTTVDAGRILNEKTARSQIIGGTIGGIGQALLEETITDPGTGRIANATLGDYLIPVNAGIPDIDIDVVFVGEPDPLTPLGAKGMGEIGLVGIAAAVANAVHHATGSRIRSLPITIDRLL